MVLKAASPLKRQQVVNAITESIMQGQLPPGGRLNTVREMSDQFSVSTSVIHHALKELVDEGMLECRGAQGFYVSEDAARESNSTDYGTHPGRPRSADRVFLVLGHHSDLVWQHSYADYELIREAQINTLRKFLDSYENCHIFVEQSEQVGAYLKVHPEALPDFTSWVASGRLSLTGGFCIPDLNLCYGESLIRNLQAGRKFYRDTFGADVTIACENDAFGMCGQLPQILIKSGYTYLLPGRRPAFPRELPRNIPFRWAGMDGTEIIVTPPTDYVTHVGYGFNLPVVSSELDILRDSIRDVRTSDFHGDMLVLYFTETEPLREEVFCMTDSVNREAGSKFVEFGSVHDYCSRLEGSCLPVVHGEFNPIFTGCYTTRMAVKKELRKAENKLFSAEMLSAFQGKTLDSDNAWKQLCLASFHDAICGCHTDAANADIMRKLEFVQTYADKTLAACEGNQPQPFQVFSPNSSDSYKLVEFTAEKDYQVEDFPMQRTGDTISFVAPLKPCSMTTFNASRQKIAPCIPCETSFQTEFFDVDFSTPYPVIRQRELDGQPCLLPGFGEIVFRRDTGSMWSEEFQTAWLGRDHLQESVVSVQRGPVFYQVLTEGQSMPLDSSELDDQEKLWPGFGSLTFRKDYRFYHNLDYFTLKLTLNWSGSDTKIALRLPLSLDASRTSFLCDVPFASVARQPYYEVPRRLAETRKILPPEAFRHASGDWPVLHWVDCADGTAALAVANEGTPGWQWNDGALMASLLRSGTKVADGAMKPQQGALDNGTHDYEFAFQIHSPLKPDTAPALGRILNRRPVAFPGTEKTHKFQRSMLSLSQPNLVISSIRQVTDGWIVRIYETLGRKTTDRLKTDFGPCKLMQSDLTEQTWTPCDDTQVTFRPFEINTYKLTF